MDKIPDDYSEYPEAIMTNFNHSIDTKVAAKLKSTKSFAQYAGLNFCGYVWWKGSKSQWKCEVWVYGSHRETISAETLEEIMGKVSEKYGSE